MLVFTSHKDVLATLLFDLHFRRCFLTAGGSLFKILWYGLFQLPNTPLPRFQLFRICGRPYHTKLFVKRYRVLHKFLHRWFQRLRYIRAAAAVVAAVARTSAVGLYGLHFDLLLFVAEVRQVKFRTVPCS